MRGIAGWTGCALAALLGGCVGTDVNGSVDGEPIVRARDAFYDRFEVDFGVFDYEVARVTVTDLPEACAVFDAFVDAQLHVTCERRCEELREAALAHELDLDEYWSATFTANVSDGEDGEYHYDRKPDDEHEFSSEFVRWDLAPLASEAECEETCRDGKLLKGKRVEGEDGELEVAADGDELEGTFDVDYEEDTVLTGRFDAERCDLGGWIF